MLGAGIADQDGFLLGDMTPLPVGLAWINSMAVVEASANGEAFDDLVTHFVDTILLSETGRSGRIDGAGGGTRLSSSPF